MVEPSRAIVIHHKRPDNQVRPTGLGDPQETKVSSLIECPLDQLNNLLVPLVCDLTIAAQFLP